MPELPEVETIARNLRNGHPRHLPAAEPPPAQPRKMREPRPEYRSPPLAATPLPGKMITGAHLLWARTLAHPSPAEFPDRIVGQRIEDIGRRGKYLIFHLSTDKLLIHLRMSGDMLVTDVHEPVAPHDRLTLTLDNALRLAFNDTRKFGRAWLVADAAPVLDKLGPEPLSSAFTHQTLYAGLQTRRRQLKPLLLDQSFIAGLGNIYTDEALHLSGLHPLSIANTLTAAQAARLWQNIQHVLREGIRNNGASIDWVYRGGEFQNYFQAYGRKGEPCYQCGAAIERILVGQRSTHFCPHCQPKPKK